MQRASGEMNQGGSMHLLVLYWTSNFMSCFLSKATGAKGPFLADTRIKLRHCLELTVLSGLPGMGRRGSWRKAGLGRWQQVLGMPDSVICQDFWIWRKQSFLCVSGVCLSLLVSLTSQSFPLSRSVSTSGFTWLSPGAEKTLTKTQCPFHFRAQSKPW